MSDTSPIIQFFTYDHLRDPIAREISSGIAEVANAMEAVLTAGPEKSAGLRKLLEAKDCFVRAAISTGVKS